MICFQISIFEPLETTSDYGLRTISLLWFAFKLVSLNHWKQLDSDISFLAWVVICFQISIFEPLETTASAVPAAILLLWFAFKLVSLNHWKQLTSNRRGWAIVVICFQISIFEPLETTGHGKMSIRKQLWFAFKLVSLNHWKQPYDAAPPREACCDLLSN